MTKLDEHTVFANYIGRRVLLDRLIPMAASKGKGYVSYADSDEYILLPIPANGGSAYNGCYKATLIKKWRTRGIDFRVFLYIREGVLIGGHISRCQKMPFKSRTVEMQYLTDATRQELRAIKRILAGITAIERSH